MTSRRSLLQSTSAGFGWLAFNALHQQYAHAAAPPKTINPLAPKAPHFAAKAKRVIFMFMQGGPSHLDTFDYHAAFFMLFVYRIFGTSWLHLVLAALALFGMGANFVGFMLIKHGGRAAARKYGMWCIAASTSDAALLLLLASILGA